MVPGKELRGGADHGKLKLTFAMANRTSLEKLRFRKGEIVLISSGDPLTQCVGEASI